MAGTFAIALWAFSLNDDPNDERTASFLLWSMFWPLGWVYRCMTGKAALSKLTARSEASRANSQTGIRESIPQKFRTIREAKEYLAGAIAEEAERTGKPLTEVERKMLYFSEAGWTLPEMKAVSAEFDNEYDQDEYEKKIASIIVRIQTRLADEHQDERTNWSRALEKLSQGDHYLFVLANASFPTRRGTRHPFKLLIIAFVFFALAALNIWFRDWLRNQ